MSADSARSAEPVPQLFIAHEGEGGRLTVHVALRRSEANIASTWVSLSDTPRALACF